MLGRGVCVRCGILLFITPKPVRELAQLDNSAGQTETTAGDKRCNTHIYIYRSAEVHSHRMARSFCVLFVLPVWGFPQFSPLFPTINALLSSIQEM